MGKWWPKHVEALSFNKVNVIVKYIKLLCAIKLLHDARSTKHKIEVRIMLKMYITFDHLLASEDTQFSLTGNITHQ
jgi:hypothetical protein